MPYVNICVACDKEFTTPNKRMPSCDGCRFGFEGKRLAAQLKERDAIIDEAMRLLAAATHPGKTWNDRLKGAFDADYAALRARIEEIRK